jgi:SAM-dependent methyltransferase
MIKPIWESKYGKGGFLKFLNPIGKIKLFDIGCGNNSPVWFKSKYPNLHYVGLDVSDYNQGKESLRLCDEYILVAPKDFESAIASRNGEFDIINSSHNIEHCLNPYNVAKLMMRVLKPGGFLYLSTPCEESVKFPKRKGCLNFFDDPTHVKPVDIKRLISILKQEDGEIVFFKKRYRPFFLALKGLILEPYSYYKKTSMFDGSTWALYGFETVIWVKKASK